MKDLPPQLMLLAVIFLVKESELSFKPDCQLDLVIYLSLV